MEENLVYKKRILKLVGIFLGIILGFTVISKTVYTLLLPQISIDQVTSGVIETKALATGRIGRDELILAGKKVAVKSPIEGEVTKCYVEENQKVKKGEVLFEIQKVDNKEQELQEDLAEEELKVQKAAKQREKQVLLQEQATAQKELADKEAEIKKSEESYELFELEKEIKNKEEEISVNEELFAVGALSKTEYENSKLQLELLKKQKSEKENALKENNELTINSLTSHLTNIEAQLAALEDDTLLIDKRLEAKGEQGKVNTVTSPIDGIVYEINVATGASVLNQEQMVVVVPDDIPITLSFQVSSKVADKITVGQNVYWSVNDAQETATVLKKNYDTMNQSIVVTGEIDKEKIQELGVDYMNYKEVNVQVISTSQEYDLLVPNGALVTANGENYLFTVEKKKGPLEDTYIVHKNTVTLIEKGDYMSAISGALKEKDDIAKNPSKPLKEGMEVAIN